MFAYIYILKTRLIVGWTDLYGPRYITRLRFLSDTPRNRDIVCLALEQGWEVTAESVLVH